MRNFENNNLSDNINEQLSLYETKENSDNDWLDISESEKEDMNKLKNSEKLRLNKVHEAILNLDVSDKTNWKYNKLRDILSDDISTSEKIELLVKTVHEFGDKINLEYDDHKSETVSFYCWNRALFFNYLFTNEKYKDSLQVEKSTICLPYGHLMNIVRLWWKTYIVDWWVWCFNEIDGNYEVTNNWSWKCVKLEKPIQNYKDTSILYPFTSFPFTENLNNDDLEIYTSYNLKTYSYFFVNRLYEVAQEYDKTITDRAWLERFVIEVLDKKDKPLEWILLSEDNQLKNSKEIQMKIIENQIKKAEPYDENLRLFKWFDNYLKTITRDHPDLMPTDEGREGILRNFNFDDIRIMDWLNMDKKDLESIVKILNEKIWNVGAWNIAEAYSSYILERYKNFEPILDDNRLNGVLMEFLNALKIKSGQLNKTLDEYLPLYIKEILSKSNK